MNKLKISFIGGGNMTEALFDKALEVNIINPETTMICDIDINRLDYIKNKFNVVTTTCSKDAIKYADIIILAINPHEYKNFSKEISVQFKNKAIISIMAGITVSQLENDLHESTKILRVMLNTPVLVGEGMTALCSNSTLSNKGMEFAIELFEAVGKYHIVDESLIDTIIGVSSSAPAYVYMFIEAMADAGVLNGMPRDLAYEFAAQTVLGAAKMVLETKTHPGELKDRVCTPGGITIKGVASLEKDGLRNAVINAVNTCVETSKKLSIEIK